MVEIDFKDESYCIMGACFEVYKDKGAGFLEPVYQALAPVTCIDINLKTKNCRTKIQNPIFV